MNPQGKDQQYRLPQQVQEAHQGEQPVGELPRQKITCHGTGYHR